MVFCSLRPSLGSIICWKDSQDSGKKRRGEGRGGKGRGEEVTVYYKDTDQAHQREKPCRLFHEKKSKVHEKPSTSFQVSPPSAVTQELNSFSKDV